MSIVSENSGWDPHQVGISDFLPPVSPLYNQLVEYNPLNVTEIVPDLATGWDLSDDAGSFTFDITEGAKWTDGADLTIDDVVFSLDRILQEGEPRPRSGYLQQYVTQVEKVDQNTVKMDLAFPSNVFLKVLAVDYMKIIPKHVVEAGVDINIYRGKDIVSGGPFKAVSFDVGTGWEHEKNPTYFKEGLPYFDGIKGFTITDTGTQIAAVKSERLLLTANAISTLQVEDAERLLDDSSFTDIAEIFWFEGADGEHLYINSQKPPFDNDDLRRAIFLALDRQRVTEGIGRGRFQIGQILKPSDPMVLPLEELLALPGYRQLNGEKHPDDLAEARRLMEQAGYPGGEGLSLTLDTFELAFFSDATQIVKEQLEEALGLDLTVRVTDIPTFFGEAFAGEYTISFSGFGTMIPDPDDRFQTLYVSGGTFNAIHGWNNPAVDDLFARQQRETNFEARQQLNYEMQRLVLADAPGFVEIMWATFPLPINKRIKTAVGHYVVPLSFHVQMKHEHEWLEPK